MCGFVGYVLTNDSLSKENISKDIKKSIYKLSHRGPDHLGHWNSDNNCIHLAHARLSILDLSSLGNQPMFSSNGQFIIVFNGEIYNHLELRKILSSEPILWKGNSDTETLLNYIQVYGIDNTLSKCRGMFSFALYDKKNKKLFLVRDLFGEKPLFYSHINNNFIFASELKAIKEFSSLNFEIDYTAIGQYFKYNYIPYPRTVYLNVKKLPPASILELSCDTNEFHIRKYYNISDIKKNNYINFDTSNKEIVSHLNELIESSVHEQMISDVPLGTFLSGGIDSSLVTAIVKKYSEKKINTFTIAFQNNEYDESISAKKISQYLNTDHHELMASSENVFELFEKMPEIYDEPFGDSSQLPSLLISSLAKKNVTVALTGDGGDELFGGYNRYLFTKKYWNFLSTIPIGVRSLISELIDKLSPNKVIKLFNLLSNKYLFNLNLSNPIEKIQKISYYFNSTTDYDLYDRMISIFHSDLINSSKYENKVINDLFDEYKKLNIVEKMMLSDVITYLTDDILCKVDRSSMFNSLETRAPFLNKEILNFSFSLPYNIKINNSSSKWLLRECLYKHIPATYFNTKKSGFGIPLEYWFKDELKSWAEDLLFKKNSISERYISADSVIKIWNEHISGKKNNQHKIWSLVMFNLWAQKNNIY